MKDNSILVKISVVLFHFLCGSIVCRFAYLCYSEFLRNEDFCEVSFKKIYSQGENLYPSVSLCFTTPIYDQQLHKYDPELNSTIYQSYLTGRQDNNQTLNISYDEVSLQLEDFLMHVNIIASDEDEIYTNSTALIGLSLIHISEPTRPY